MKTVILISAFIFLLFSVGFGQQSSTSNGQKSLDQNVRILHKPKPAGPDQSNGSVCIQGTVILRIEFLKSGEIGEIIPVKSLPYGLTENSITSAKKIRFKPARKNGKAITVFRQVEFPFSIY